MRTAGRRRRLTCSSACVIAARPSSPIEWPLAQKQKRSTNNRGARQKRRRQEKPDVERHCAPIARQQRRDERRRCVAQRSTARVADRRADQRHAPSNRLPRHLRSISATCARPRARRACACASLTLARACTSHGTHQRILRRENDTLRNRRRDEQTKNTSLSVLSSHSNTLRRLCVVGRRGLRRRRGDERGRGCQALFALENDDVFFAPRRFGLPRACLEATGAR